MERIASESAATPLEQVVIAGARRVIGVDKRLQELTDNINQCVEAQRRENNLFWNQLMHLDDHLHQFTIYMKSHNKDFPDSLLQQFNFGETTEATATKGSEEATIGNDKKEELEDADQATPKEAEGDQSETDSSLREEEEGDSEEEKDEALQMVHPKRRQKHIIRDDEDKSEEEQEVEPPVPVISNKAKRKL